SSRVNVLSGSPFLGLRAMIPTNTRLEEVWNVICDSCANDGIPPRRSNINQKTMTRSKLALGAGGQWALIYPLCRGQHEQRHPDHNEDARAHKMFTHARVPDGHDCHDRGVGRTRPTCESAQATMRRWVPHPSQRKNSASLREEMELLSTANPCPGNPGNQTAPKKIPTAPAKPTHRPELIRKIPGVRCVIGCVGKASGGATAPVPPPVRRFAITLAK